MTPFAELREAGLKHMREGRYADAEESFRAAHGAATTEAEAALAEIHCASVAILQGESSAPVAMLREILIRRHSTLHVLLASYYLTIHLSARRDREAAERYLAILLDAAAELDDPYYLATSWDIASEVALSQGSFEMPTTERSARSLRSSDARPRRPRRWRAASSNTTSATPSSGWDVMPRPSPLCAKASPGFRETGAAPMRPPAISTWHWPYSATALRMRARHTCSPGSRD